MAVILFLAAALSAATTESVEREPRVLWVTPRPDAGIHWPYYVYVPDSVRDAAERGRTVHVLVIPNDTGVASDDRDVHKKAAWQRVQRGRDVAQDVGVALLVPVFPRPAASSKASPQSLDRASLRGGDGPTRRIDLQLLAMIDDLVERLELRRWTVEPRVLLKGTGVSGLFVSRFTLLHPERVLGAVVNVGGGWLPLPVDRWADRTLRYPLGVAGAERLVGRPFDAAAWARVPMLVYAGGRDDRDLVADESLFADKDRQLVDDLFGREPMQRWQAAATAFEAAARNVQVQLYPDMGRQTSGAAAQRVRRFLSSVLEAQQP